MRDIVLAKQFKDANITFACQNLKGNIIDKIPYKTIILKSDDIDELIKLIKEKDIELLVIDHYGINHEDEKRIKKESDVTILSFDDSYEKHYCDIVLNHNIFADKKRYCDLTPSWTKFLCGEKYTLIRDEFKKDKKIKRVFLAMGGADTANLNIKILKVLKKFKHIKVDIITTDANKNLKELKSYTKDKKWIKLHVNSNKIAKLMKKADFAIITPSVVLHEVLYMELPFIAIKTADNQKEFIDYLKKNRYFYMEKLDKKSLFNMIASQLIDIVPFYKLKANEKEMVLKWRNDDSIKRWMFHKKSISLNEHLDFIKKLPFLSSSRYFLVKYVQRPIGVIDLTNIDYKTNSAYIGLYAKPTLKGVGGYLLNTLIKYSKDELGLKKLIAQLYDNNQKALYLYEKFNFKTIQKDRDILTMELDI